MALLDNVKSALRIDGTDFDVEVTMLIDSAKQYLKSSGVADATVDAESDPRVEQLITIYCKSLFGYNFKDNITFEFPRAYGIILDQLRVDEDYV